MSIASRAADRTGATSSRGVTRQEVLAAVGETLALFLIFIVAFTGRDAFGDNVKALLVILSVIAGGVGALAGLGVLRRAFTTPHGRVARVALAGWMLFAGIYSVVHVLS